LTFVEYQPNLNIFNNCTVTVSYEFVAIEFAKTGHSIVSFSFPRATNGMECINIIGTTDVVFVNGHTELTVSIYLSGGYYDNFYAWLYSMELHSTLTRDG